MKFSKSLKLNHLFRRLYHKGKSAAGKYLVIYCRRNGTQENRIGLTVSAKLGHAVVRNRVRRRLREVYRLNEDKFTPGWDIVVVARSRCVDADFQKLTQAYLALAENEDDEAAEETMEQCDDVFYEHEEEINELLKEYAAKIKL